MEPATVSGHNLKRLLQGQTLEVLLDDSPDEADEPVPEKCHRKLGIACTIKQSAHLESWLCHHDLMCIERFYMRVEDTPELANLLCQPPWADRVHATFTTGVHDWMALAKRQALHVQSVIELARADGITHLLHIDDDELLWLPRGIAALHRAMDAGTNHFITLMPGEEAVRVTTPRKGGVRSDCANSQPSSPVSSHSTRPAGAPSVSPGLAHGVAAARYAPLSAERVFEPPQLHGCLSDTACQPPVENADDLLAESRRTSLPHTNLSQEMTSQEASMACATCIAPQSHSLRALHLNFIGVPLISHAVVPGGKDGSCESEAQLVLGQHRCRAFAT